MYKIGDVVEINFEGDYFIGLVKEKPDHIDVTYEEGEYIWTQDYDVYGVSNEGYWLTPSTKTTMRILDPAEWMVTVMRGYYVPSR